MRGLFVLLLVNAVGAQRIRQQQTGEEDVSGQDSGVESHRPLITSSSQVCTSPNGFFADPEQCDKYYECTKGVAKVKFCSDGLVFISSSPLHERCDYPWRVKCGERTRLQPAKPSKHCPRQFGLYNHEQKGRCEWFWSCDNGVATRLSCPGGLAFHENTGLCEWPTAADACIEPEPTTTIAPIPEEQPFQVPPKPRRLRKRPGQRVQEPAAQQGSHSAEEFLQSLAGARVSSPQSTGDSARTGQFRNGAPTTRQDEASVPQEQEQQQEAELQEQDAPVTEFQRDPNIFRQRLRNQRVQVQQSAATPARSRQTSSRGTAAIRQGNEDQFRDY